MNRRRVEEGVRRMQRHLPRPSARVLLRSRVVQAVLVAAAVAGAHGATARPDAPAAAVAVTRPASGQEAGADPQTAALQTDSTAPEVALSEVLVEKYREDGYQLSNGLAEQIVQAAQKYRIDPEIAFGLVAVESEFKTTARSPVGALGLAQLMPATASLLRPGTTQADLRDPEVNLNLGFRYLRDMLEKYDDNTELALLAYNRGPGTVDRILEQGGNPDNGYAAKVMGDS